MAIHGIDAVGDVVQGDIIGTDITGTQPMGNSYSGVYVGDWGVSGDAASGATIGGTAAGAGNLISANGEEGIWIDGWGATGNLIQGNMIGTDISGDTDTDTNIANFTYLGNHYDGISIDDGAENTIGGTAAGASNLILLNDRDGVVISGSGATGNLVLGNTIGTLTPASDDEGDLVLGNDQNGVEIDGAGGNTIGGTTLGAANVLSANSGDGLLITGAGATANRVLGNLIGTDRTDTQSYGNFGNGVEIDGGGVDNTIGGTTPGAGNVIANSFANGVLISGTTAIGNLFQGNMIGTDFTGTQQFPSFDDSIEIDEGVDNTIGGSTAGAGNVIVDSNGDGVQILGSDATGNLIQGNMIGLDGAEAGSVDIDVNLDNSQNGVAIDGGRDNTIGGTGADAGNVIGGNGGCGILISGAGATGNLVEGNLIGATVSGDTSFFSSDYYYDGNDQGGIYIDSGGDNTVGGTAAGAGNTIAYNEGPGVVVTGNTAVGDEIVGNNIFNNLRQAIDIGDDGATYNAPVPRVGPNDFQNFPIVVTTAAGRLEGWLDGSTPDTTFRVNIFASTGYGPGGAGEAVDLLGSLEVTTDADGSAVFAVPYRAPADLPIISATATSPLGNTSEVSAERRASLEAPRNPCTRRASSP